MQQTGITKIEPAVGPTPLYSMDAALPEDVAAPDRELFIRRAFEQDARLGCELLFRRYYDALCSHAVRFVSSKAVAEDLVADVFCQFYAGQVFQTITTSYRAYLYKTVRHRAYNYLRQTFRRDTGLEEAQYQVVADAQQPDAITHYEELHQDVERALQTLPVQRRRIYLMHRFEGKKYAEIADELNLSSRTVEVQIRQASHHLRNLLKDKWFTLLLGGGHPLCIGFRLWDWGLHVSNRLTINFLKISHPTSPILHQLSSSNYIQPIRRHERTHHETTALRLLRR